jgi:hypothetical protein
LTDELDGAAKVAPFRYLGKAGVWYGVPLVPDQVFTPPAHLAGKVAAQPHLFAEVKRGRPRKVRHGENEA